MTAVATRRSDRTVWSCSMDVGPRVKEARVLAGLSQRQLGFRGCSPAYLSRIEGGDRWPSAQVIEKLAEKCNVSAEWLAWGTGLRERYDPREDVRVLLARRTTVSDSVYDNAYLRLTEWAG